MTAVISLGGGAGNHKNQNDIKKKKSERTTGWTQDSREVAASPQHQGVNSLSQTLGQRAIIQDVAAKSAV